MREEHHVKWNTKTKLTTKNKQTKQPPTGKVYGLLILYDFTEPLLVVWYMWHISIHKSSLIINCYTLKESEGLGWYQDVLEARESVFILTVEWTIETEKTWSG